MNIFLQLENGRIFNGKSFGKLGTVTGELIFNTAMIGYEEIISDPTNTGKILAMTYPIIGSYGFNFKDMQSDKPSATAIVCRSISKYPSNFRCEMDIDSYFKYYGIVGIEGINCREIVQIIRKEGSLKAVISPRILTKSELKELFIKESKEKLIYKATSNTNYEIKGNKEKIGILDFGIKKSLLEYFKSKNYYLNIYSAKFNYQEILNSNIKALVLSNGPGNPYNYKTIIENIRKIIGKIPIISFGIGTDLLTIALKGEVEKLPYGHRTIGSSVKDISKDKIYITTQNHKNFISKIPENSKIKFINTEDKTVEGYEIEKYKILSIHFQPEGSPGPREMEYVINDYFDYVLGGKNNA